MAILREALAVFTQPRTRIKDFKIFHFEAISLPYAVKIYANFAPDKMIDMDGRIDGRAAKRKGKGVELGSMHK